MTETTKKRLPALTLAAGLSIAALLGLYFLQAGVAAGDPNDPAAAAQDDSQDAEKAPIPVEAAAVETGTVSSYVSATANLVPENEVRVLAEWEGRVARLRVEEGDRVAAGAVLVELDRQDGEILLNKAKVKAATEELAYERARKLRNQDLLAPDVFDQVALGHELASQELAEAEWRLEKTLIRAPFAGRIVERLVQPGQHVRRGDELFAVADFDPLVARIYLPEKDVLALEEGRDVKISLQADEAVSFAGSIRRISPVVDTATGTVKVTVEARAVPAAVRPGAFVRIDIVRDTVADAVLVPREAVVRELQKAYVFVAQDGVAAKRAVDLGIEEDGRFEALSGIAAGERVIVAGQGGLKDGSAVQLIGDEVPADAAVPAS